MDVGQIKFQVLADGLDVTLKKAQQLQTTLNNIDGRSITAGGKSIVNVARKGLSAEQQAARIYHAQSEKRIKDQMRIHKIDAKNHDWAMKKEKELANARSDYMKHFSRNMVNAGAQMQTLGAAMQRVTAPFTNVYRGLTMGIGYRLLYKVMDSINGAFSRYDTIQTYSKVLTNLGVDATKKFSVAGQEATDVYHNLENAVLGLPTGIDEIINSMRRYAGATGEAERATKLAIAANNAYIAGHMGEREKLFTERQLVALAGGATLSTNQWDSLRRNAPLAMKVIAKEMNLSVQSMIEKLKSGEIAGQDFLDVFIKAGTEGKLAKSAQVMKQTWDAVAQNFQNRMNAMGEGILKTLDKVFKKTDGRTFLQHVLGVDKKGNYIGGGLRGIIDDMSESAQKWIKAHPEAITNFFDNLSKIDWKGIVGGFAEFGLAMGRFYAFLGRVFGSGKLVKFMLGFNLAGKAIQVLGGFTKGTAWLGAWLMTIKKFGFAGGTGKIIANAAGIAKGHGALVGATKTIGAVALSWQDVASKAITVAAIPAIAWSLKEVALALQEFGKVDIGWVDLTVRLGKAMEAVTFFATMAGALGTLMSSTPIGWIGSLIEGAGILAIASIAKAMKWVGEGLNAIANAEIPNIQQIESACGAMAEIATYFDTKNPIEAIGTILDAWVKGFELDTVTKIADAFKSIKRLSKIKIDADAMERARQNFADMGTFIKGIETIFSEETMQEMSGGTNGAGYRGNTIRYSNWRTQVEAFASIVENVDLAMVSMKSLMKHASKLQRFYDKMGEAIIRGKSNFSWSALQRILTEVADGMYGLISGTGSSPLYKLKAVGEVTKNMDMDSIVNVLDIVPKIVNKLTKIGNKDMTKINLDNLDLLGEKIQTFVTKMSAAFSGAGAGFGGVSGLAMDSGSFLAGVDAIKKAIEKLNSIPMAKDMTTVVTSVQTAVSQLRAIGTQIIDISVTINANVFDNASAKVAAVNDAIQTALDGIKDKTKTVTVKVNLGENSKDSVTPYINRIASNIRLAINSIPSSVNKSVKVNVKPNFGNDPLGLLGGRSHNGGRIKPLYRAHGGSVFNSRGTDTIPTMLTKGEYVINRMAASRIGDAALWRLNHMDISGALQALSARVGQSIVPRNSVINNTTNNTHNTHVDIHNAAGAGVGLGRANRWVRGI